MRRAGGVTSRRVQGGKAGASPSCGWMYARRRCDCALNAVVVLPASDRHGFGPCLVPLAVNAKNFCVRILPI